MSKKKISLLECKECGQKISKRAKQCPKCGYDNRGWWDRRNVISQFFIGFFGVIMLLSITDMIFNGGEYNEIDTSTPYNLTNISPIIPAPVPKEIFLPTRSEFEFYNYSLPKFPNEFYDAMDDYNWRGDLIREQTTRLDMYYAVKSGEFMPCEEFSAWLGDLRAMTKEFIKRNLDSSHSGYNYAEFLNANVNDLNYDWYSREYNRVKKNDEIIKSDTEISIDNFNNNVEIYNQECAS